MATFTPNASVIVPVYNGAETISVCLESLLSQNYPSKAYDIIVVENGSTDQTAAIVEKYPVRLYHNDQSGPAPARNLGIARSTAEIIAFTDADCIADPNWLSELMQPYADSEIGGVGGNILAYEHADRNYVEMFSDKYAPLVNFMSGENEFLPHLYTANASYRSNLLREIGGFNARLVTAEDVDLSWRLQLQTETKLHYSPNAIVYHRHRATHSGLARQYRQYGFGEIVLDTLYSKYPGYSRNRRYQFLRILKQISALPRYLVSGILRQIRLATGRMTPYDALVPWLWFLIESNNIRGKLEGLAATHFMRDAGGVFSVEADKMIARFYGIRETDEL